MDSQTDVETLRSKLREMRWADAMALADAAGVPRPTVTHFRKGRIEELGGFKVQKLQEALLAREAAGA